jgi:hypothetical protein
MAVGRGLFSVEELLVRVPPWVRAPAQEINLAGGARSFVPPFSESLGGFVSYVQNYR